MKQSALRFLLWSVISLCFGVFVEFLVAQDKSKPELDRVKPETVKGCYELTVSAWRPTVDIGKDAVFITPPHRIQLFAEKGKQGWEAEGFVVKAAPGVPPSIHRGSYWLPKKGQRIEIVWTTGFSGLVMEMKVEGDEM